MLTKDYIFTQTFASFRNLYQLNRRFILDAYKKFRRRRFRPQGLPAPEGIPDRVMEKAKCCFVLSTGRCGTGLMTELLYTIPRIDVVHRPAPELIYQSKLAYLFGHEKPECYRISALHSRYEPIRASYLSGGIFVETNNRITFFAPYFADIFKKACFVHLVRNPKGFVRSGLRRGYYTGNIVDEGRIVPRAQDPVCEHWVEMSQTEKIAWLWNATNQYIEEFKKKVGKERVLTIRSEDLFTNEGITVQLFQFIGTDSLPQKRIRRIISVPRNVQRSGDIPPYKDWPGLQKERLKAHTPLAELYGYEL